MYLSAPVGKLAFLFSLVGLVALSGCMRRGETDIAEAPQLPKAPLGRALVPIDAALAELDTERSGALIGVTGGGSDHVYDLPGFSTYGTADVHTLEREYITHPVGGVLLLEINPFAASSNN